MFIQSAVFRVFTQTQLKLPAAFWQVSQGQEPIHFELVVKGTFTGGLIVPSHCCTQIGNERTVLFKYGQLLFVLLSVGACAIVVERCKI